MNNINKLACHCPAISDLSWPTCRPSGPPLMAPAETPFNLWRKRSYEPAIRAYLRGTIALITLLLLILFAVFIVYEAADLNQLYALRSYRHTDGPPQPNLFTNHCTSALAEGGNLDEFAQLFRARTECRSIAGTIAYYVPGRCLLRCIELVAMAYCPQWIARRHGTT